MKTKGKFMFKFMKTKAVNFTLNFVNGSSFFAVL